MVISCTETRNTGCHKTPHKELISSRNKLERTKSDPKQADEENERSKSKRKQNTIGQKEQHCCHHVITIVIMVINTTICITIINTSKDRGRR